MVLNAVNAIPHQNASNNWSVYTDIFEYRIQIFDAWNTINNILSIKIYPFVPCTAFNIQLQIILHTYDFYDLRGNFLS
jgi:hypothetical protein